MMNRDYWEVIQAASTYRFRVLALSGTAVYIMYNLLDRMVYPQFGNQFLLIRVTGCAIFLFFYALSYFPAWKKVPAVWLNDVSIAVVGMQLCYMIYLTDGIQSSYYQGISVVLMAMFLGNSFLAIHNLVTGFVILLFYTLAVYCHPSGIRWATYISNNSFMIGTLYFVAVLTKIFQVQHYNDFLKAREVERTARELDDAYKKLRDSEKLKDDFFANISHELRTPLTLILAPLESLLAGEYGSLGGENQAKIVRTMHNNAVRLLQMIAGLLDFSKLEAGKVSVNRETLDAVVLTRTILDDFSSWMNQKSQTLAFYPQQESIRVEVDRYLYERILFNLLSNAVKFTPNRGSITVRLFSAENKFSLSVQDTGIGIDESDRENLFQKFRQLEGSAVRRFEGTGLGLALVKEFAALLGGAVSVVSQKGKGSTFTVEFDALKARESASGSTSSASETRRSLVQQYLGSEGGRSEAEDAVASVAPLIDGKPKVLIAEDNAEMAYYISSILSDAFNVKVARDGEEAAQVVRQWSPLLILSDVMMPKKDGLTLCRELKADSATSSIPVVLLTALTHRDALIQGWQAGADEYLFKPFHPTELLTRVRSLVSNTRARKDAEQELVKNASQLAHAQEELTQLQLFAHITTHDLQEPLRKIMLFAEQLKTEVSQTPPEVLRQRVEKIAAAAERLSQMIKGLRDLSQIDRGPAAFEEISLKEVVNEAIGSLDLFIAERQASVEIGPLPKIRADHFQMLQLFTNLIHNGIKFCAPGTVPHVRVSGRFQGEGWAEVDFEDNGIGLDSKYAEKIFEPFQRLHNLGQKEYEGTGLGLTIVEKIALRHGGKISVKSTQGVGSVFTVRLPVSPNLDPN